MPGKLYVVGLGPGDPQHLTPAARTAVEADSVVTGYRTYLELIPELLPGKETFSTGMRQETERCREALRRAGTGATVALVCSGDAGVYGMAGLVLELQQAEGPADVAVEIVPGVSAVQAAAARLGAPLMHDFAVISLSDLLTPWPLIRRRLEAAAAADFVVALYNPKSKGRTTQIEEAQALLLRHRDPATPVGIVRHACREQEEVTISDLANFTNATIDMFSLVIIGNSATFVDRTGRLVTPRGYEVRKPDVSPILETPTPALFVGGTGSDVGKSVITAGLCRLLKRRGIDVAPFKAQNMALNSAVTPQGGEIGRAQALQAAACVLAPHTDMNPVLLKPNSELGSQVVVHGRPVGNMTVRDYHAYKREVWPEVEAAYRRLAAQHQAVILEGAGSIAEINLKEHDITNLRAARLAEAGVLLVADIDRGGVFASIIGTLQLLTEAERSRVLGVVINRFRGDASLLQPGIMELEQRCGVPVLGVVPHLKLQLPEEDSVALARKLANGAVGLQVGVVRLPRISNYTDFDPFEQQPDVALRYLESPEQCAGLDLLIVPGTKNTLADLAWLRGTGMDRAILDHHTAGGRTIGICGGFQLLGETIADPEGVESGLGAAAGLGLLDVETVLKPGKQTHQVVAEFLPGAAAAGFAGFDRAVGYEIHCGETGCGLTSRPLLRLRQRSGEPVMANDGAVSADGRVWGTYLHGFFDDARILAAVLAPLRAAAGMPGGVAVRALALDAELDRWADHLAAHLDLARLSELSGLSFMEAV